jgi:ATP-dependent Clp protease protease subunit
MKFVDENEKNLPLLLEFEEQIDISNRIIYICNDIEESTYKRFCFSFNRLDATQGDIRIHLTSLGGDVILALGMFDLISKARNCVIVAGYGNVCSAATIILQAGTIRLASEECRFLIHDVSGGLQHQRSQDLLDGAAEIKYLSNRLAMLYQKHSTLSKKQIRKFMKSETFFSAQEALQFGLIDQIINKNREW